MHTKPPPEKVAKSLVIYLTITLFAPLAVAIALPAEGGWWALKILGGLLALNFVGTFLSRREFCLNLLGPAYAGFLLVLALYTVALFLKSSGFSLVFYAAAILLYLGFIPAITKHIREQRNKDQDATDTAEEEIAPAVDKDGLLIRPPRPPPPIMRDPFLPPPLVATNVHRLDIIPAWQTAAAELGIRITTNKVVTHPAKFTIMFPVYLPDFGTSHGILLWTGSFDDSGMIDSVEQAAYAGGYGYSVINPESYSVYDRELFTSFLCRLHFVGQPPSQPGWYIPTYE